MNSKKVSSAQATSAQSMNQRTQGAMKDQTAEFQRQRQRAQQRKAKANSPWDNDTLLRDKMERFKPLNNKFGKKKKKEKCNEDEIQEAEPEYKGLRNSTLSDDSNREGSLETSSSVHFDTAKDVKQAPQYSNIQGLATKASSDSVSENNSIDSGNKGSPFYVEVQEEVERKLNEAEEVFKDLKKNQAKRLRISFDMDEKAETKLQNQLFDQSRRVTNLIKECEKKLKQLKNHDMQNKIDEQIKDNILCVLASNLKDLTHSFKQNEKHFYIKVKDIHGEEDTAKNKKQKELDDQYFQSELQQMQANGLSSRYKDEEIQNLVKSINDLASIFKDLSVLVIEQGTILDRIDYNVQEAKDNVQLAVKELTITQERETSTRSRNCITCQVITIVILVVVLYLKFL